MPSRSLLPVLLVVVVMLVLRPGVNNAQGNEAADTELLITGRASLVNQFQVDLGKASLPKTCSYERFPDTQEDDAYNQQGGLLVSCKSGDAAQAYVVIGKLFLQAVKGEKQRHLGMTHTLVQSCTNMKGGNCLSYPCPVRPKGNEDLFPAYYFACYEAGKSCKEAYRCTKK